MTKDKFQQEVSTLKTFFTSYCEDKHEKQKKKIYNLEYKDETFSFELYLCEDCHELISYSFKRLQNCPHEIKPRCRKCPNPCYEKTQWKSLAKIMKYSAIKLGLKKLKKVFSLKK